MLFDLGSSTLQQSYQRVAGDPAEHRETFYEKLHDVLFVNYLTTVKVLYVTLGHWAEDFLLFFLIFLANRFNSAYYPVLITGKCGPVYLNKTRLTFCAGW
jgi:hypothetical protein